MKIGTRIVRGADWKWGDQDGPPPGEGRIISEVGEDGWVRVEWDNGATNSYRMGKEGQYDLRLADNVSTIVTPDTETEEDISLCEMHLSGMSHPTKLLKNACTKMLKIISVSIGQHANKMDKTSVGSVASMFRSILSSKMGSWSTLGFLRAISTAKNFSRYLTLPVWINVHIDILNAPITCEQDVYKKVQCLRLLQSTLVSWTDDDTAQIADFIEKVFGVLGKIVLYCPNDLSLQQNPADVKARVLLASSHSGTVAEEIIALLRKLHTQWQWNSAINSFLAQKLCIATELLGDANLEATQEADKAAVVSALNVIGGCDPRPRIGMNLTHDALRGTITNFTQKGKVIVSIHNSASSKKLSIAVAKDCADNGAFSLSRLPLNEMLLNSWSIMLYGPGEWKSTVNGTIETPLLRAQQIHLAALNATCILFRHQSSLRKILRQRAPGLSRYSSDESISEHDDCNENVLTDSPNVSTEGGLHENELLMQTMLARATQTNPLKAHYSYAELAMAALNVSQLLASHVHSELNAPMSVVPRTIPPPVQPTLIHGVPIYNDGVC